LRIGHLAGMPRRPRVVIPGVPHHVTQRGNDRQLVFYSTANRSLYLSFLARHADRYGTRILGYCLMNNHVHLIAVPEREDSLAKTLARTQSEYAQSVNRTRERSGHLWQNRFFSCPMGPTHLQRAMLYVDMNPVRAGLVAAPCEWLWSSARVHVQESAYDPVMGPGWEETFGFWDHAHWQTCLQSAIPDEDCDAVRCATRTGEPLGASEFVARIEREAGRDLRVLARGRPPKNASDPFFGRLGRLGRPGVRTSFGPLSGPSDRGSIQPAAPA
jgi:putative transposase